MHAAQQQGSMPRCHDMLAVQAALAGILGAVSITRLATCMQGKQGRA